MGGRMPHQFTCAGKAACIMMVTFDGPYDIRWGQRRLIRAGRAGFAPLRGRFFDGCPAPLKIRPFLAGTRTSGGCVRTISSHMG